MHWQVILSFHWHISSIILPLYRVVARGISPGTPAWPDSFRTQFSLARWNSAGDPFFVNRGLRTFAAKQRSELNIASSRSLQWARCTKSKAFIDTAGLCTNALYRFQVKAFYHSLANQFNWPYRVSQKKMQQLWFWYHIVNIRDRWLMVTW
jgi:hypothetical protein